MVETPLVRINFSSVAVLLLQHFIKKVLSPQFPTIILMESRMMGYVVDNIARCDRISAIIIPTDLLLSNFRDFASLILQSAWNNEIFSSKSDSLGFSENQWFQLGATPCTLCNRNLDAILYSHTLYRYYRLSVWIVDV